MTITVLTNSYCDSWGALNNPACLCVVQYNLHEAETAQATAWLTGDRKNDK